MKIRSNFLVACAPWALATALGAQVQVTTTTPTLADIVRQVGGTDVAVESVMRGRDNAHNVSPTPSAMLRVRRADLFVHGGLDGEPWVPLLLKGARNPDLLPGAKGNVDASTGIALKEVPRADELSRAHGHIHVFGNPHYMLDPRNGRIVARTIAAALARIDPEHEGDYERRRDEFDRRMTALEDRLRSRLEPYGNAPVAVYHRTWTYFLDRFGLRRTAEIEAKPGIAPGPAHLRDCIASMRQEGARVVLVETYQNPANAAFVAEHVGGRAVVLAQEVGAIEGVDTYEALFEHNVDALVAAFAEAGDRDHDKEQRR